jgi:hypothetical protein
LNVETFVRASHHFKWSKMQLNNFLFFLVITENRFHYIIAHENCSDPLVARA